METTTPHARAVRPSPASRQYIEEWLGAMADRDQAPIVAHLMCPAGKASSNTILCVLESRKLHPSELARRTGGLVFGKDAVVCLLPWTPTFQCPLKSGKAGCDCSLVVGAMPHRTP